MLNILSSFYFNLQTRLLRLLLFAANGFKNYKANVPIRELGDQEHQVFFGYYDLTPFDASDTRILAQRAPLGHKQPDADTQLEIGYYNLSEALPLFQKVDVSSSWCWQQGCRLQWYPLVSQGRNDQVIYNVQKGNHFGARIQNISSGEIIREYEHPVYSLTPDGRYGYLLNFSRLGRLRPGYGYAGLRDESEGSLCPDNEGIWRLDMESGEAELLFSNAQIATVESRDSMEGAEHYFNHICVSPFSERLLFFHIWVKDGKRRTRMLLCDLDGKNISVMIGDGGVAHYAWKSADEILCYSMHPDSTWGYHLYSDNKRERKDIGRGVLKYDGHPGYSADSRIILTDTYQDTYSHQNLLLYRPDGNSIRKLGAFYAPFHIRGAVKCDLHPRWSPSEKYIAIDSAHNDRRSVYILDVSQEKM